MMKDVEFENILKTAAEHGLQADENDEGLIWLLFDQSNKGIRIADGCAKLGLTKETVRYRLLSLQAAGIVTSRKISRSERRYYLKVTAWET